MRRHLLKISAIKLWINETENNRKWQKILVNETENKNTNKLLEITHFNLIISAIYVRKKCQIPINSMQWYKSMTIKRFSEQLIWSCTKYVHFWFKIQGIIYDNSVNSWDLTFTPWPLQLIQKQKTRAILGAIHTRFYYVKINSPHNVAQCDQFFWVYYNL